MVGRKFISHRVPDGASGNPEHELYFITINTLPRGTNQLALPPVWNAIIETIEYREALLTLNCRLLLAMPDHLHGLFRISDNQQMTSILSSFKRWISKQFQIHWQRGFFEHRLRNAESAAEKRRYILQNPVRAGLVPSPEMWPFQHSKW